MDTKSPTRTFPDVLKLRTPRGLLAAVATAAQRRHTTSAEWSRQALLAQLHAEGIDLGADVSGREAA